MADRPPRPTFLTRVLSYFLLALAVSGYLLCGWSVLLLRTVPTAPLACAHEEPNAAPTSLQEELFVGVTSVVERPGYRMFVVANSNAAICVVRASDGAILRHYPLGENMNILGLAQADGVLYYLLQDTNQQNQLCAMRVSNGTRLWCQSVPTNIPRPYYQGSPLIISDNIVYLQALGKDGLEVLALRANDGTLLWKQLDGGGAFAVANSAVYILPSGTQLCSVQASDGTSSWCTPLDASGRITTMMADSTGVYVLGSEGSVIALRLSDGSLLWQRSLQTLPAFPPAFLLEDGRLYISTSIPSGGSQEILTALQASDGTILWQTTPGSSLTATSGNGVVYLGSRDNLQALQESDGKPRWQKSIQQEPQYRLVIGGSSLYVVDVQGNVSAFSTSDGRLLWEHTQCTDSSGAAPLEPRSKQGASIWCTWGTDSGDNGSTWQTRNSINLSSGAPGVLATGA